MNQIKAPYSLEQLKIMADAHRFEILNRLTEKPATLTQLGKMLQKSPGWIRHHIKTLEKAGLVEMLMGFHDREKYYRVMLPEPGFRELLDLAGGKPTSLTSDAGFYMKPIGVIRTPFKESAQMPIQSSRSDAWGEIEVFPEYEAGLESVDDLSHLILFYVFHQALESTGLMVTPFLDDQPHGVFATRFYRRPNPIGISVVRLVERNGPRLKIQSVDMLDGTPLLDIKPYVPEFDVWDVDRLGWYASRAHP